MLGGRVAESIIFDTVSTGARDDLERVTKLAYDEVARLGFNERLGNLSFKPSQGDFPSERPYSQKTAQLIDEEARKLIAHVRFLSSLFLPPESLHPSTPPVLSLSLAITDSFQAYQRTEALLRQHHDGLVKIAERLLNKEKIGKEDMVELLGERQWKERRTYQELAYEDEKEIKRMEEKERKEASA